MTGIYSIFNMISGKRYIGQSVNMKQRIKQHYSALNRGDHSSIYLQRAFKKYGKVAFEAIILERCLLETLTLREQYWMDYYKDRGIYNTAPAAGSNQGIIYSVEHNAKIAAARRGKKATPEARARMSAAQKGRTWSEETRKKMASRPLFMLGKHHTEETKAKLRSLNLGKKMSPEAIAKTVAAHKGKKRSVEAKARMSAAQQNRSAETLERMSKAQIGHVMSVEAKVKWMAVMTGKVVHGKDGRFVSSENIN